MEKCYHGRELCDDCAAQDSVLLKLEMDALLKLELAVIQRRAHEPKHSMEDHECAECTALSDLHLVRRALREQK